MTENFKISFNDRGLLLENIVEEVIEINGAIFNHYDVKIFRSLLEKDFPADLEQCKSKLKEILDKDPDLNRYVIGLYKNRKK